MLSNIKREIIGFYHDFGDVLDRLGKAVNKKREELESFPLQSKFEEKIVTLSKFIKAHIKPEELLQKQIFFAAKMAGRVKIESREFIAKMKNINPYILNFKLSSRKELLELSNLERVKETIDGIKKPKTEDETQLLQSELVKKFPEIAKSIKPCLEELKRLAEESETGSIHIKKGSLINRNKVLNSKYGLTASQDGKVFIHIPKSKFASGGSREVKLAVELTNHDIVARGVLKNSQGIENITGDLLVMKNCPDSENLGRAHAITVLSHQDDDQLNKNGVLLKYYSGGDLEIKSFSGNEFIRTALGIARGVEVLHESGLAHRDLKPQNIMLDNGVPKVVDFDKVIHLPENWTSLDEKKIKIDHKRFGNASL